MDAIKPLTTTYQSCVVELNPETRECLGIAQDATVIFHSKDGRIEVEIVSPPLPALLAETHEMSEELRGII